MSQHDSTLLVPQPTTVIAPGPLPRRINVAVNSIMMGAIDLVIDNEHVTLTEAVRRLVAYGNLVYEATKVRKARLIVCEPNGGEREVLVL